MAAACGEGEHWDGLLRKCLPCRVACQRPHASGRCAAYCESVPCKALPGRYYDLLLRKCVRCADVCGRHPAECSHQCRTSLPPLNPTADRTHIQTSRGLAVPTALDNSNIFIYCLLALCTLLVVSSLSIALAVFPRRPKDTASSPGPRKANPKQQCVVKLGEEVGPPCGQQNFHELYPVLSGSSRPTEREPSEDPHPTETCVCVHCFPDVKALGQASDRPGGAPFTFYQQAVLHKAQSSLCLHPPGAEVREEAAVG